MPRIINCRGCGNKHEGAGGSRCRFLQSKPVSSIAETMDFPEAPPRDSPEYRSFLESKILEQQELLRRAEESAKIGDLENQLSSLKIRTEQYKNLKKEDKDMDDDKAAGAIWFTGRVLSNALGDIPSLSTVESSLSKTEKDIISKLRPVNYLSESKPAEKMSYREFAYGMTKVLQFVISVLGVLQRAMRRTCHS